MCVLYFLFLKREKKKKKGNAVECITLLDMGEGHFIGKGIGYCLITSWPATSLKDQNKVRKGPSGRSLNLVFITLFNRRVRRQHVCLAFILISFGETKEETCQPNRKFRNAYLSVTQERPPVSWANSFAVPLVY